MAKHYQGFGTVHNIKEEADTMSVGGLGCECPVCGADHKKEYSFDRYGDITMHTHKCQHFIVQKLDFDYWVADSYGEAEGIARLTKMDWDSKTL